MTQEQIEKMIENMDKQVDQIRQDALKTAWNMRGGLSYNDALMLSWRERKIITEIIKENIKVTKKSGLPYF